MRSLLPLGVDIVRLALDTAVAAYLLDPSTDSYRVSDLAARFLEVDVDDGAGAKGQGAFVLDAPTNDGGDDGPDGSPAEPSALGPDALESVRIAAVLARLRSPMMAALAAVGEDGLYADIEQPLVRVLARMEVVGIPVDREVLRAIAAALTEEVRIARANHPGPGRRAVQGQLGAAAPHRALREAGSHSAPQDQDRLLDRRPDPRATAGPAPHRRGPAPLPRGGEAALHLRREPGRRGGRRRPHPRHVPPDRGPHRPPLLGSTQPPQHPGPYRRGKAVPRGFRAVPRAPTAGGRLRPGRAAGHRPPFRRTPA